MAEVQLLIKYIPELLQVLLGKKSYIRKIDCNNAFVETTIELGIILFLIVNGVSAILLYNALDYTLSLYFYISTPNSSAILSHNRFNFIDSPISLQLHKNIYIFIFVVHIILWCTCILPD